MKTLLKNCNLIDGVADNITSDAYIVIVDEEITEVGQKDPQSQTFDKVIDCKGSYVTPGLIDAHVHLVWDGSPDPQAAIQHIENDAITLRAYKHSLDYLQLGITTVRDVGSPDRTVLHVRDAINTKLLPGPTVICSGTPIAMTGGHIYYMSREVDGPDEVRKAARTILKEGADLIKLIATGGIYTFGEKPGSSQLTLEELQAAVAEAHKKNKKVAAHAEGYDGIMDCIEAGVDTIEHGIYADKKALSLMKEKNMFLVPTMIVMQRLAVDERIADWALEKAKVVVEPHIKMLKEAIKQGIKIVTGTDCGSPVTPPEYYFDELLILNEAGMPKMGVIHAATSLAAECLDLPNRGVVKAGKKADLLILEENPLDDLSVFKNDKKVMKNGKFVESKSVKEVMEG